jgi:hypothetical protein
MPRGPKGEKRPADVIEAGVRGAGLAGADRAPTPCPPAKPAPAGSVDSCRVISRRRPLVREISIDRVSYKNASAKQTHD